MCFYEYRRFITSLTEPCNNEYSRQLSVRPQVSVCNVACYEMINCTSDIQALCVLTVTQLVTSLKFIGLYNSMTKKVEKQ
jgi:hypothetical protein